MAFLILPCNLTVRAPFAPGDQEQTVNGAIASLLCTVMAFTSNPSREMATETISTAIRLASLNAEITPFDIDPGRLCCAGIDLCSAQAIDP
jgi:hypothetical protein